MSETVETKGITNDVYLRKLTQANTALVREIESVAYGAWNPLFMSAPAEITDRLEMAVNILRSALPPEPEPPNHMRKQ